LHNRTHRRNKFFKP